MATTNPVDVWANATEPVHPSADSATPATTPIPRANQVAITTDGSVRIKTDDVLPVAAGDAEAKARGRAEKRRLRGIEQVKQAHTTHAHTPPGSTSTVVAAHTDNDNDNDQTILRHQLNERNAVVAQLYVDLQRSKETSTETIRCIAHTGCCWRCCCCCCCHATEMSGRCLIDGHCLGSVASHLAIVSTPTACACPLPTHLCRVTPNLGPHCSVLETELKQAKEHAHGIQAALDSCTCQAGEGKEKGLDSDVDADAHVVGETVATLTDSLDKQLAQNRSANKNIVQTNLRQGEGAWPLDPPSACSVVRPSRACSLPQ